MNAKTRKELLLYTADCYVPAVAKVENATALFAKREKDLEREISRNPFDVNILFLEDVVGS